jgi:hypothetical protein
MYGPGVSRHATVKTKKKTRKGAKMQRSATVYAINDACDEPQKLMGGAFDDNRPGATKINDARREAWDAFSLQVSSLSAGQNKNISGLYDACDVDRNGHIDFTELRTCLRKLEFRVDARALWQFIDIDGNGEVTREEFISCFYRGDTKLLASLQSAEASSSSWLPRWLVAGLAKVWHELDHFFAEVQHNIKYNKHRGGPWDKMAKAAKHDMC